MDAVLVADLLGWSTVINYIFLLVWMLFFTLTHNWLYQVHYNWFPVTEAEFNKIHYAGMTIYKILLFVFNLVPFVALRFIMGY